MAAGAGGRRGSAPPWVAGLGALAILGVLALAIGLLGQGGEPVSAPKALKREGAGIIQRGVPKLEAGGAARAGQGALRIMVLGDSLAGSLAPGLASAMASPYSAVFNGGSPGCSLASYQLASNFRFTVSPGAPCVSGDPKALLKAWDRWMSNWLPSMVVYLARNDLADQQLGGSWTHVGQASFDRYYDARLRAALKLFTSYGLPAVLMVPNQADSGNRLGVAVPEEEPARRAALAKQLRRVVASYKKPHPSFQVVDLSQLLSPSRVSASGADPAQLFCPDGAHFTPVAGEVVAASEQDRWTALAPVTLPAPRVSQVVPELRPAWWRKLGCDPGAP